MKRRLALHTAIWVLGAAVFRIAVIPPEQCPPTDPATVRTAISAGVDWIARNVQDDGRYTYGYFKDADRVSRDYNFVRHAGVTMALYQLAAAGEPTNFDTAEVGLRFMLDRVELIDGDAAFVPTPGWISLGAQGLFLAALAHRRLATGDPVHDELMRGVGRFMLRSQLASGAMLASWDPGTGKPVPNDFSRFSTGEAMWALALLDEAFPGEGWDAAARRTSIYLATQRDEVEGHVTDIPDHWAAYGLTTLAAAAPIDDAEAAYARQLTGYFNLRLTIEAQRTGEGLNRWVRWYPGPPAGYGTAGEGLGRMFVLAGLDPRLADMRDAIGERLRCTAGLIVELQADAADAPVPSGITYTEGAWFYRDYVQMDDVQHVLSALLYALPAVEDS